MRNSILIIALALLLPLCLFATPAFSVSLTISDYEKHNLQKIRKLLADQSWHTAKIKLEEFKSEAKSPYAIALVHYYLAQLDLHYEQPKPAFAHLLLSYQQAAFAEQQQNELTKTLAQLALQNNQPKRALDFLEQWITNKKSPFTATDYLFSAQLYAATEQWQQCLNTITQALNAHDEVAPIAWLKTQVVALLQLKRWQKSSEVLYHLLTLYPDEPEQWRQLVAVYLQQSKTDKALAIQRIATDSYGLNTPADHQLLVRLYLTNNQPVMAANTLNKAIDAGLLVANQDNLNLLANSWLQAQETAPALKSLTRINKQDKSLQKAVQIATIQLNNMDWHSAQLTLATALTEHGEQGELAFLLGLSHAYLQQYNAAIKYFLIAKKHPKQQKDAAAWLMFLDRVK